MRAALLTLSLVALASAATKTYKGLDYSETNWNSQCFRNNQYDFAIARGFFSGDGLWSNVADNLRSA